MNKLHDYFYAVAAACIVAIGVGFVSVADMLMDYDKHAQSIVYEYEQKTNSEFARDLDCSQSNEKALCRHAIHFDSMNAALYKMYVNLLYLLLALAFFCFLIGLSSHIAIHLKQKRSKEK